MDFEEENIYTMQCGGGGDSDSGDNGGVTGGGDEDRSGGDYSDDSGFDEGDVGGSGFEVSPSSPTNAGFSTDFSTDAGFLTSPEITPTPEAPSIEEITQDDADSTSADFSSPDVGDSLSGGDPSINATIGDNLKAAPEIIKQLSLPQKIGLGIGTTLLGGFPLTLATGALMSYTQSRGINNQTASNTSNSMSGLLSDSTFDSGSDAVNNNTFVTRGLLQNPNTSPAVQFLANVRQSTVMDRYNAAKERLNSSSVAVTPFGRLAVSASPFYNFLEQRNLNRGIL